MVRFGTPSVTLSGTFVISLLELGSFLDIHSWLGGYGLPLHVIVKVIDDVSIPPDLSI